ncbi:MAG TPA: hypothetical protein VJB13_03780 [Candidatus Nanoarchaeia archaeon]|nr:hypothetical protein [Candidatus Nanoarchaeia archaeon]
MIAKKGDINYIVWIIILLVFFFVVAGIYFILKGQGEGLLDKFFNLF